MSELFTNGARGRLLSGISAGALSLSLRSGQGALFPNPGSGDYFRASLERADLTATEIVICTARVGDVLTIVRGQEGSTAVTFSALDRVRLRLTAGMLEEISGVLEAEDNTRVAGWCGQGGSFQSEWGMLMVTSGGTQGSSGVAATNQQTSIPGGLHTATTAAQILGYGMGFTQSFIWRGNAANRGGFDFTERWAISVEVTATYGFWGCDDNAGGTYSGGTPNLRTTTAQFGIGFASSAPLGSNFFLFHSDGLGVVTAVDTGIVRDTSSVFEVRYYAPPFASYIEVTFKNLRTGQVFQHTITTNLPSAIQFLTTRHTASGAIGQAIKFYGLWRHNVNQSEPTP